MANDKVITPEFRVSYSYVFTPQENRQDDGTVKREYSLTAIFPKGADLTAVKAAAQQVLIDKFGPDQSKWPGNLRNPFRKCNERWKNEGGKQVVPAGYEDGDAIFITAKATEKSPPGVVDQRLNDIIESRDFYSGCYARASVRPYYYEKKGNRGVAFGLNNVQKLRDGDPLGGRSRPTDDFQAVEGGTDTSSGAASVFD
jgi:hypothetical protein